VDKNPNLHLVTGFLGSGKTTAIVNACKSLVKEGKKVGVVTNDQGKYQVDTAFYRLEDLPAVEVAGGCFCCNFNDLEKQLGTLIDTVHPDVIFAESVGSCADLVATVVKPMLGLQKGGLRPASYSTFVDARLLRMRLEEQPLPFSDGVVYIFDKQIEETRLLVVNKMDLVPADEREALLEKINRTYPQKVILPQISLDQDGVKGWVQKLQNREIPLPSSSLQIDYPRYGEGEHQLAWLDEEMEFLVTPDRTRTVAVQLLEAIVGRLQKKGVPFGHVKFVVRGSSGGEGKISFPTLVEKGWQQKVPPLFGSLLYIMMNARVECPVEDLENMIQESVKDVTSENAIAFPRISLQAFHPSFPNPTYRFA
jgi:G3E family GTPase